MILHVPKTFLGIAMPSILMRWYLLLLQYYHRGPIPKIYAVDARYSDAQGGRVRIHRVTGGLD